MRPSNGTDPGASKPRLATIGLWIGAALLSSLAGWWSYRSPIDYTFSDPWGNLLTAQALLEHRTVKLDAYRDAEAIAELDLAFRHRAHLYSFFPLGTPLLAVPAVGLARLAGYDMAESEDNTALQRILSALTVAFAVPLLIALCRPTLSVSESLLISAAFAFGSPILSTLGTALWSSNLAFLCNLGALLILTRRRLPGRRAACVLAFLLFVAYLCRPTAALLGLATLAFVAFKRRVLLLPMGLTWLPLAGLLIGFSWIEYGDWLPPYYLPSRLGSPDFKTALLGHLASPSRGILVLCPFLLLVLAGTLAKARRLARNALFLLVLSWLLLHWIAISSYSNWWGGWSFGNRFFADAMPGLVLWTALLGGTGIGFSRPMRRAGIAAFAVLAAAAVYIHSWKGLYDRHPFLWCQDGSYVEHLFDWRHPQFLATPSSLAAHRRQHLLPALPTRPFGKAVLPASRDVLFSGWSLPEGGGGWRWTDGPEATLLFRAAPPPILDREVELVLVAGTYGEQRIGISVNGVEIGTLASTVDAVPTPYSLPFDGAILSGSERGEAAEGLVVEIKLSIPGARSPATSDPRGRGDRRQLGVSLRELRLDPAPSSPEAPADRG